MREGAPERDFLKRTKNQVRNGYGVETTPQYLAEFFPAYDQVARAKILNDMDAERESFRGRRSAKPVTTLFCERSYPTGDDVWKHRQ